MEFKDFVYSVINMNFILSVSEDQTPLLPYQIRTGLLQH